MQQKKKNQSGHNSNYGCRQYELDKVTLQNANLTADEYEKKVKELARKNRF